MIPAVSALQVIPANSVPPRNALPASSRRGCKDGSPEQRPATSAKTLNVGLTTLEDERQPSFDAAEAVEQSQQNQR